MTWLTFEQNILHCFPQEAFEVLISQCRECWSEWDMNFPSYLLFPILRIRARRGLCERVSKELEGKLSQAEDQNSLPSKALSSDYNSWQIFAHLQYWSVGNVWPKKSEHPRALMEAALRLKSANVHQPILLLLLHVPSSAQSLQSPYKDRRRRKNLQKIQKNTGWAKFPSLTVSFSLSYTFGLLPLLQFLHFCHFW